MLVFLRRSSCPSYLRLEHNTTHTIVSLLRRRFSSTHTPVPDTTQLSGPRNITARRSTATVGKDTHKTRTKPKDSVEPEESRPNILEQTKVQDYLDYVASTNNSVTLEDIERCKPKKRATPGTLEYAEDYNSLLENLVRSFSKVQLARFLELYGLGPPVKRTKWYYAESIIERQWKWPSLTDIQKRQRDWSEITYKTFPLKPSQAFLILGKDGINLLSLSRKYNVHVSFAANPLSLRVEGLRGSLDNISQYIAKFKDDVRTEIFTLPGGNPPRSDLLQRISRITGVLTENIRESSICMTYRNAEHQAVNAARKLTMRSVFEPSSVSTLVEIQKPALETNIFQHTYSLYPFLSSRSLPWDAVAGSLFRLRRVGEWLRVNPREGALTASGGTALTMNNDRVDIRHTLLRRLAILSQNQKATTSHREVIACFGHVLACTAPSQRATIVSPPQAQGELSQLLTWAQSQKRIFIPSLPAPLLDSKRAQQRLLHRVLYQVLPSQSETEPPPEPSHSTGFFKAECHITVPNPSVQSLSIEDHKVVDNPDTLTSVLTPKYWTGVDTRIDLMLPNCSMDIRFFASDSTTVAKDLSPQGLQAYFRQLQSFLSSTEGGASLPDPPLSFVHQGVTYGLKSTCSVRQSAESSQIQSPESAQSTLHTVSESILDLDSNEKYTTCELRCPDVTSYDSWTSFLHTCDRLVALTSRPIPASNIPDIPLS